MTRIRWEIILAEFVSSGDLRLRQPTNFRDDAIYQCTGEVLPWFEQCKVEDLDALLDSGKTGQKLIQRFGLIPTSREATSPASVVESVCQSLSQPTKYPLLNKSQMIAAFRTLFQGVTGVPSELRFIKMLGDPPK